MPDFINKPNFKKCNDNTLIKYIPSIITYNNNEVSRLFNDIFEFGNENNNFQYIKVPIVTNGVVRGNTGYFNNLSIKENITFDASILENAFKDNIVVNHQKSNNRFKNDYDKNIQNEYTHDAESIFYKNGSIASLLENVYESLNNVESITQKLNNLDSSIQELTDMINIIAIKLNIDNGYNHEVNVATTNDDNLVEAINSPTTSYTYSSNAYKNN